MIQDILPGRGKHLVLKLDANSARLLKVTFPCCSNGYIQYFMEGTQHSKLFPVNTKSEQGNERSQLQKEKYAEGKQHSALRTVNFRLPASEIKKNTTKHAEVHYQPGMEWKKRGQRKLSTSKGVNQLQVKRLK